jgi:hypothetical protein
LGQCGTARGRWQQRGNGNGKKEPRNYHAYIYFWTKARSNVPNLLRTALLYDPARRGMRGLR